MTLSTTSRPTPTPMTAAGTPPAAVTERRLGLVLAVNAATSTLTGLVMALAPGAVDDVLDTGRPGWVRLIGVGLVLFGLDVGILSRASLPRLRRWTPFVIAADVAWVIASVAALVSGAFAGAAVVLVLAVAITVDLFATLQWMAWRRLGSAT